MAVIYFVRSARYDYLIEGYDLYDSFDLTARRVLSPAINLNSKNEFSNCVPTRALASDIVFSAPERRSIETARLLREDFIIEDNLRDIHYSMSDFISRDMFYAHSGEPDVDQARRSFMSALVSSTLQESFTEIIHRIDGFIEKLIDQHFDVCTVVTHSFLMKVIEGLLYDPSIRLNHNLLLHYYDGSSLAYPFHGGFMVEREQLLKFLES